MQAITHPSTVWACAVMPNGDLLAGCANGNAYVWSKTAERAAPDEQVVLFKESVAAVALPAEQAEGHGLDTSNMASEEALANPGEREGQHKIIKDSASGQPTLYTWSAGERTWNKVGEIVGSKDGGGGGSTLGKRTYEGKEYDYLFDIDLDGATAKLPFNKGDDPWMAAQQFIWRHGLDQAVLDTVASMPEVSRAAIEADLRDAIASMARDNNLSLQDKYTFTGDSLFDSAYRRVAAGETSVDEVLRVMGPRQIAA